MWNKEYLNQIIERTNKRIAVLQERLIEVSPGRQMPVEDQVTIGSGRQLEVAVLFLDICRYSSWFSDTYDSQKVVLAIMNIFMAEMMNVVRDHKGEFEKNTGDGLMAYFGADSNNAATAVESAINAALTAHYFNDNLLTPYLQERNVPGLQFRIAIDYGKVTIGRVGVPGGLNSFVAIGTTANIACKLLQVAEPGDIAIGEHVKAYLPEYRKAYCQTVLQPSGFEYVLTKLPYWAYRYTGRWKPPVN